MIIRIPSVRYEKKTSEPFYNISHDAYLAGKGPVIDGRSDPGPKASPTIREFVLALRKLLEGGNLCDNAKICLAALNETPLTMSKISKLLGYKASKDNKAPRLLLGNHIGMQLCNILAKNELHYPEKGLRIFVSRKPADPRHNNEDVYKLKPNFQAALKEFPLADWKKLTPGPLGASPLDPHATVIFGKIDELLAHKNQVILFGPPGTGKTYWANRYVNEWTGEDDPDSPYIARCTFHPEYGYEHFIEGFKPELDKSGQLAFRLRSGVFKDICQAAIEEPEANFYLIIDEINRGDIPRIFGELITLIEADKRNESFAVRLPHSGELFHVPENVYIIATMNTADRSIALLDTALRRRFGFIEMAPDYTVLDGRTDDGIHVGDWLQELNKKLVEELKKIRSDAKHVQIGHSYLMPKGMVVQTREQWERIVRHEILPLLEEYCYEENETFEKLKKHVEDSLKMSPSSQSDVYGQEELPEGSDEQSTVDDVE